MKVELTKKEQDALRKLAKSMNLTEEEIVKYAIKKFIQSNQKVKNMGIFGKIALAAYKKIKTKNLNCEDAWIEAGKSFKIKQSILTKCCPKRAFIGLCRNKRLKDINCRKICGRTQRGKNEIYANILAEMFLAQTVQGKTKKEIWEIVRQNAKINHDISDPSKNENGHIDVVEALFNEGAIINNSNLIHK